MRYYRIEIDDGTVFTSFANGQNLRGALNVEMDIPVASFSSPSNAGAILKVWGVPISMINQSKNLNRKNIKIFGGFQKGLPLANPSQAGLLVQGWIYQAYGNWQGTDMSLDLVVLAGQAPPSDKPIDYQRNIVLNWKKGSGLADAVKSALQTAYSGFTVNANVNSKLTAVEDTAGAYPTLSSFATYLKQVSKGIIGTSTYNGVDVTLSGNTINVFDAPVTPSSSGTSSATSTSAKTISFKDLIGQPTWIQAPNIAFKTAMRSDIQINDQVTLPKTLITNSQQAQSSLINQVAAQQGTFVISSVHHVGNFRQPDGYSWISEFNAYPVNVQGNTS